MGQKKSGYIPGPDPDLEALYATKLSTMVRCETVPVREQPDPEKFRRFHKVLEELYPTVFAKCEKYDIDGDLLLKWPGRSGQAGAGLAGRTAPDHGPGGSPPGGTSIRGPVCPGV